MAEAKIEDVYLRLGRRIGWFENSKTTPKIFKHLLTLEQAQLADAFPGVPEELAAKLGRDLESVKKDLQYMYRVGVGTPSAGSRKWNLPRNYMLFVDKICTHHRNAATPFRDLLHEVDEEWQQERMKIDEEERRKLTSMGEFGTRIIPAYTAVKDKSELQPWESMKAILQMASRIAVVDCPCRMRAEDKSICQMPGVTETCFLLNRDADYAVDSGSASKYITVDEAMKLVERMEKVGMIHNATNIRGIVSLLCNCCIDHCIAMRRFYSEGKSRYMRHPSRYLPVVNPEFCVGCGVCVERCFFDAVTRKRDSAGELKAVVDPELCMGCGSCVVGCPHGAMDMECVKPEEYVPKGMGTRPSEVRTEPTYEKYLKL